MTVTGPTFVALQVRDLERSAAFYETQLGLRRLPSSPPGAVVFDTSPASFAVREPLPGVDLDAARPRPGLGVALWLHADDAQALHDSLAAAGVPVPGAPFDGPFGRTFTFFDPDGYAVTIHDRAPTAPSTAPQPPEGWPIRQRADPPRYERGAVMFGLLKTTALQFIDMRPTSHRLTAGDPDQPPSPLSEPACLATGRDMRR